MFRFSLLAAAALLVAPGAAFAQPGVPGQFQVIEAKAEKDKITWTTYKAVPVQKEVAVQVLKNGMLVTEKQTVTVTEYVPVQETLTLKALKATDGNGKAVDAEKLAEILKEGTPVVFVSGPVADKHRKLFKGSTVFLEIPVTNTPGAVPAPPVPVRP